ncbi:MAG: response regulator transcription factor [Phycisphaerales bacterium]|nr:MAG: response regulator transcription factor [Phycisphaerales bacterium]
MGVKILLVEDHVVMREGLRILINQQADMEVVGEADDGKDAAEMARQLQPDVVIMDVCMRGTNGVKATRQIKAKMPDLKVIALSAYDNREYIMGMAKAGMSGYLLKDCAFDELVGAIRTVLQGKSYLSPGAARVILDVESETESTHDAAVTGGALSESDRQLIRLLAEGRSAREIAESDNLSIKTIEGRRRRIMKKTNVATIAELIRHAVREGIVSD